MIIRLNGQEYALSRDPAPLPELLRELGLEGRPVLVEHNGVALRPGEIAEALVHEGDVIEMVQLAAGG
ncbi:MAG TPA: sulfur carrier protein ThiS [Verrucomicrobiales bacterium]|nr:sulfur carrier protein ThiS [Verrucomicrobiales bacterium]